jgi:hypothetical protein
MGGIITGNPDYWCEADFSTPIQTSLAPAQLQELVSDYATNQALESRNGHFGAASLISFSVYRAGWGFQICLPCLSMYPNF